MKMRLESVNNAVSAEFRKIEIAKKENTPSKVAAYTRRADSTNLSSGAKNANDLKTSAGVLASHVEVQPDIRTDKLNEVKKKIDEGFYNSSKFADQLADKMITDFGF